MPCANTVFGNSPEPQIVNDPKSLYQSPSGAHGPVFTQSCNRRRSCREICRSATRARMCCQTGRGRLENRIFGNGILPEDCPDQILPGFILAHGIALRHEPPICRIETLACRRFSVYPALCEHDQRPAHGETLSSGYSLDLNRQVRWNRDALADGWRGSRTGLWAVSHTFIISSAPLWCRGAPNRERIVGAPGNWPETAFEETSIRPGRAVEKPNTAVRSPRRGLRGRFGPWTAAD